MLGRPWRIKLRKDNFSVFFFCSRLTVKTNYISLQWFTITLLKEIRESNLFKVGTCLESINYNSKLKLPSTSCNHLTKNYSPFLGCIYDFSMSWENLRIFCATFVRGHYGSMTWYLNKTWHLETQSFSHGSTKGDKSTPKTWRKLSMQGPHKDIFYFKISS